MFICFLALDVDLSITNKLLRNKIKLIKRLLINATLAKYSAFFKNTLTIKTNTYRVSNTNKKYHCIQ